MYQYVHGGYAPHQKNTQLLDFSANINPLGMPDSVRKALAQSIEVSSAYPDPFCAALTRELGKKLQVKKNHILCGNGAAGLLFDLALAVKPRHTLLLAPTFADYAKACTAVGSKLHFYSLEARHNFLVQPDILDLVQAPLDLIIICNPNNPTSCTMDKELLLQLVAKAQKLNIRVLVDECFMDFVSRGRYSLKAYLELYPNLSILQAFTKMYAMAGVRLGYLLTADTGLLDLCRSSRQDWTVSTPAQYAGLGALAARNFTTKTRAYINRERTYLEKALQPFSAIRVFPSQANYLLLKFPGDWQVVKKLAREGIWVRDCSNYCNLVQGYVRIAIRTHKENVQLIKTLQRILP